MGPCCQTLAEQLLPCSGPSARWAHSACVWGEVALFHAGHIGLLKGAAADTHGLLCRGEPPEWSWLPTRCCGEQPPARHGHAAAVATSVMWVHGGLIHDRSGCLQREVRKGPSEMVEGWRMVQWCEARACVYIGC